MVQTRFYDPTFMAQWRQDTRAYTGGGSPIRVAGSQGYNSFLGFPAQLRTDIEKSKIKTTMRLSLYITDAATFDLGRHKETYDKKTNGLPWYEYTGISQALSTGRQKIDITSFTDEFRDLGFQGIVLYGAMGFNFGSAYGLTRDDFRVVIELDGEWNNPPGTAEITYPVGGETLNGMVTLRANPTTDAEDPPSDLRYQWGIYDGTQWNYYPLTNPGQTDITVDLSLLKETSVGEALIRAVDTQGTYGEITFNPGGVFSIRQNVAPSTPGNMAPINGAPVNRTDIFQFTWRHNDTDAQSRFDLRWRLRGTTAWNDITRNTNQQSHFMGANSVPAGVIEWQVRTYDQMDLVSPWSNIQIFNAVEPTDAPIIIRPEQGQQINEARPVIQWSSTDQTQYEIQVLSGSTVIWETTKTSGNKAQTIGIDLENNKDYQFRLRVRGAAGLWSAWQTVNVATSFTPPPTPELEIETNNERGSIAINIINPAAGDFSTPSAVRNDLYRKISGDYEWIKIAEGLPINSFYTDYSPAGGVEYQYRATAWADNGTYAEGMPTSIIVEVRHVILSLASNPDTWISLIKDARKSVTRKVNRALMEFEGRPYPTAEFGQNRNMDFDLSFTVWSRNELNRLIEICESKEAVLYRDRRGRKEYISFDGLQITDENPDFYSVSLGNPVKVHYSEDVST